MNLLVAGLNHKTTCLDVRERFCLNDDEITCALKELKSNKSIQEAAILSTCNRVDFITVTETPNKSLSYIERFLYNIQKDENKIDIKPHLYSYIDKAAIRYFFRVSSSLESMIIGEPQIIGQVKKAYRTAVEMDTTGILLNKLFQKAFSVAKKVRNDTCIGDKSISISYAAVEMAANIIGPLHSKSVLLVGAGEMAELALKHFMNKGVRKIFIANRTYERAISCSLRHNATPVVFDNLLDVMKNCDIVLSSTGSPGYIVSEKQIRSLFPVKPNNQILFLDIAVPRDIDPLVENLENVFLCDIDDLKDVVKSNHACREKEAKKAETIIADNIMTFLKWHKSHAIVSTIVDLKNKFEDIAKEQSEKILKSHQPMPEDYNMYIKMVDRIVNNLLHNPIYYLKHKYCYENDPVPLKIVREMFKLDTNDQ